MLFSVESGMLSISAKTIRNAQMLKMEKPDLILVFHEDLVKSKGTRDMILITWIILGLYINIIISA
ncbi:hypothetical protein [Pseudobacteroides cellulosolvens]|uniref:hypothetical protein n=2 Tax=Pseudobacteroides cellulosolvens TaxID=35825 RepID=UPI001A9A343B|nr:hypothetical protein [Pseudobacteroides cellulosolvens]